MKAPEKHRPAGWVDPLQLQQPLVSARWLLKALGMIVALAALCVYATLCLLFYQGQWQLLFHPSRTITATPASVDLHYEDVPFDVTETGAAQLDGWWIPAAGARQTILFLHDGRGSLSDNLPQLQALHALDVNLFAIDYRGFGRSAGIHPSERSMGQDVDAAWVYLTGTRRLTASSIVIYGVGLGADIAAETAGYHPMAAAVVLDTPGLSALASARKDPRSSLLPLTLLLRSRFDPEKALANLRTPKLFLDRATPGSALSRQCEALYRAAAPPKDFHSKGSYTEILRLFLNTRSNQ